MDTSNLTKAEEATKKAVLAVEAAKKATTAVIEAKTAITGIKADIEASQENIDQQLKLFLDNSMFHAIFNAIEDGAIVVNAHGHFLFYNQAALHLMELKELTTTSSADFTTYLHEYKPDMITPWTPDQGPMSRALRGITTIGEIMYLKNEKGTGFFVSAMAVPLSYGTPKIVGAFMLFRQIQNMSS